MNAYQSIYLLQVENSSILASPLCIGTDRRSRRSFRQNRRGSAQIVPPCSYGSSQSKCVEILPIHPHFSFHGLQKFYLKKSLIFTQFTPTGPTRNTKLRGERDSLKDPIFYDENTSKADQYYSTYTPAFPLLASLIV